MLAGQEVNVSKKRSSKLSGVSAEKDHGSYGVVPQDLLESEENRDHNTLLGCNFWETREGNEDVLHCVNGLDFILLQICEGNYLPSLKEGRGALLSMCAG